MGNTNVSYLYYETEAKNTGGHKASEDLAVILNRKGYKRITMPAYPQGRSKIYGKIWLLTKGVLAWISVLINIDKNSVLIYQHPSWGIRLTNWFVSILKRRKQCFFVAFIFDLESLRHGIAGLVENNNRTNEIGDNKLLKKADCIICHNPRMIDYLVSAGFESEKLINLKIFDYLQDYERPICEKGENPSLAIAGNLVSGKSSYIYLIKTMGKNPNLIVHLYGNGFDKTLDKEEMAYHGSIDANLLPRYLEGDFGLVWDGNSSETCDGNTGHYLLYNDPHKASLYISTGIPVLIWEHAALADFIIDNGAGIKISNLNDLETIIDNVSDADYLKMCENAHELGNKLRQGYFFDAALDEAMSLIQDKM